MIIPHSHGQGMHYPKAQVARVDAHITSPNNSGCVGQLPFGSKDILS